TSDDLQMVYGASLNRSRRCKSLDEREHCRWSHTFGDQVDEVLRRFAVDARVVVEGAVTEQDLGRRHGVHLVLYQALLIGKQFVDLALCPVLVDEPVATKRVRVLLMGDAQNLGCLGFESLELTRADLQASDDFQIVHYFLPDEGTVLGVVPGGPLPRSNDLRYVTPINHPHYLVAESGGRGQHQRASSAAYAGAGCGLR